MRRPAAIVIVTALIVILAGCSAGGVLDTASVSDVLIQLNAEDKPYIVFNYSIDEERSAVIESPGGTTIAERRISPGESQSALSFPTYQSGTYTLAIRSEGETITEENLEFEGPEPTITEIEPVWSQNALQSVRLKIENRGDLPTPVNAAAVQARGQKVELNLVYRWVAPNETTEVSIGTGYQDSISIDEPGDVRGEVTVEFGDRTLNETFRESFEGPNIEITQVNDIWDTNELQTVRLRIENTGDMSVQANTSLRRGGEEVINGDLTRIPAGGHSTVKLTSYLSILEVDSPGSVSLELIVDSKYGYETATVEKEVQPPDVELLDISPVWDEDTLEAVEVTARNDGDLESEVPAVVRVNGEETYEGTLRIEAKSTETDRISPFFSDLGTYVGSRTVEVSITLTGDHGSGTASATKEFGERKGDLIEIDTRLYDDYGQDTSTLTSVDFEVRNTGDLPLRYDEIEFEADGMTATESLITTQKVESGGSATEYNSPRMTVSDGTHELTIRLLYRGETVVEETTTISK